MKTSKRATALLSQHNISTSEQFNDESARLFSVRQFDNTGRVDTVGEFQAHKTRRAALAAAAIK